jgi:hypothetical protein
MAGTAGVGLTPEALVMLISNLQNTGLCSVKFSSFDLFFFAISPANSFELYLVWLSNYGKAAKQRHEWANLQTTTSHMQGIRN